MRKADNLQPSCAVVTKSGNLNFLELSGPLQACNGTALPLPSTVRICRFPGRPLANICSMVIVVPQEGATVSSFLCGIFWRPYHVDDYNYFGLV